MTRKRLLQQEITALKLLATHENIVTLENVTMNKPRTLLYLRMEYAPHGDLHNHISLYGPLPPDVVRVLFRTIVATIQFCHDRGVCHRDIKPDIILLTADYQVRVADFGFATIMKDTRSSMHKTICGPELFLENVPRSDPPS